MNQPSLIKVFLFPSVPICSLLLPVKFSVLKSNFMFFANIMESILRLCTMTVASWTNMVSGAFNMVFLAIWSILSLVWNFPFWSVPSFNFRIDRVYWIQKAMSIRPTPIRFLYFSIIRWFKNIFYRLCLRMCIWHIWGAVLIHSKKVCFWN